MLMRAQEIGGQPADNWTEDTRPGPQTDESRLAIIIDAVREWRPVARAHEQLKLAASLAVKAKAAELGIKAPSKVEDDERGRRRRVAEATGGPASVEVDGFMVSVEVSTDGGRPNFATAWEELRTIFGGLPGGEVWTAKMDALALAHTKPSVKIIETPIAVSASRVPAAPTLPHVPGKEPWEVFAEQKAAPVVPIAGRPAPARKPHLQ